MSVKVHYQHSMLQSFNINLFHHLVGKPKGFYVTIFLICQVLFKLLINGLNICFNNTRVLKRKKVKNTYCCVILSENVQLLMYTFTWLLILLTINLLDAFWDPFLGHSLLLWSRAPHIWHPTKKLNTEDLPKYYIHHFHVIRVYPW